MPQIHGIRELSRDGHSVAEISRQESVDEKTVRKYLKQDDFSPRPPEELHRSSRLDLHKPLIDRWLREDQNRWTETTSHSETHPRTAAEGVAGLRLLVQHRAAIREISEK